MAQVRSGIGAASYASVKTPDAFVWTVSVFPSVAVTSAGPVASKRQ